jgi:hypothetical protein
MANFKKQTCHQRHSRCEAQMNNRGRQDAKANHRRHPVDRILDQALPFRILRRQRPSDL